MFNWLWQGLSYSMVPPGSSQDGIAVGPHINSVPHAFTNLLKWHNLAQFDSDQLRMCQRSKSFAFQLFLLLPLPQMVSRKFVEIVTR